VRYERGPDSRISPSLPSVWVNDTVSHCKLGAVPRMMAKTANKRGTKERMQIDLVILGLGGWITSTVGAIIRRK